MTRVFIERFRLGTCSVLCGLAAFGLAGTLRAQTTAEVRRVFKDLRDDHIKNNCGHGIAWLTQRKEQLKDAMVEELYQTDRQGRDALMIVLFQTRSFVPDERFFRLVAARMPEEDFLGGMGAHHDAWSFIDAHFDVFEPLLTAQFPAKKSQWTLWGSTWLLKKHGRLADQLALYTPEILSWVASNLRADDRPANASQAARIFLLLGDAGLPALREAAQASDSQEKNMARALIDALQGNHQAFGYLNAKLTLLRTPFGPEQTPPAWLDDASEPYVDNDKSYP